MKKALVIVESPAKAKKIAEFLGSGYVVEASVGHVRDLPGGADELPQAYKKGPYARFAGVNPDDDFKPIYVPNPRQKKNLQELRQALDQSDELYLATDEDREGEAIAWHLIEVLKPKIPVKRMVFNEITPAAIQAAVKSTRQLDYRLVDAQETRRILDRIYGWELSPVLWKKVRPKTSAGRVQSVATRILVERERERANFVAVHYWSMSGIFAASQGDTKEFKAELAELGGRRFATGKDFADDGTIQNSKLRVLDEGIAPPLAEILQRSLYEVLSRDAKSYRRQPRAPFITSTYQQEAGRKLAMSAKRAMAAAQGLYQKGYITYMRTDSTTLSQTALKAARSVIKSRFGEQFLPPKPRLYANKVKNAQEAHEAIRPAGDTFVAPETVAKAVSTDEARAYELIWKRTVASQMTDCVGETVVLRVATTIDDGVEVVFRASGTVISHAGYREVYEESTDQLRNKDTADEERRLPALKVGDEVRVTKPIQSEDHQTSPPPRYTEASLVKRLEELGVGRPSTYTSIIDTITRRDYVWKKGSALVPSYLALVVTNLMERHFPNLVDYEFTAQMLEDLDEIANGNEERVPWLRRFYFGEHQCEPGLKEKVETRLADIDPPSISTFPLGMSKEGAPIVLRVGKFGPYVQLGHNKQDDGESSDPPRANIPEDLPFDELTLDKALKFLNAPKKDRTLGNDPDSGDVVHVKQGRYGPYVQLGDARGKKQKPKTASLFASMAVESVTLDDALQLLSLPRTVGHDPTDGEAITARNGRHGPYISKGDESRSLENEEQIFTVTVEECLALLAQPKTRRARTSRVPLKELGSDPESGKPIIVKDGRFGFYVTDGEYNASLKTGDTVEELTLERACELLIERRLNSPAKKSTKRVTKAKTPAKKAAKKAARKATKSTAKKAAKKTTKAPTKKTVKKATKKATGKVTKKRSS